MLTATEHRLVQQETRVARNATARRRRDAFGRAESWVVALGARVTAFDHHGQLRYEVKLPGLHPCTDASLVLAVEHLQATLAHFRQGGATTGPTGARLAPYYAAHDAWEAAQDAA